MGCLLVALIIQNHCLRASSMRTKNTSGKYPVSGQLSALLVISRLTTLPSSTDAVQPGNDGQAAGSDMCIR